MIDRRLPSCAVFALSLVFFGAGMSGCSDDDGGAAGVICEDDELYDQLNETCVSRFGDPAADVGYDADDPRQDTASEEPDASHGDIGADAEDDAIDMERCDKDNDGAIAIECGGLDCDDNDPDRSPFNLEVCDGLDNNCSGVVNSGLECTFYAHTTTEMYKIDPFKKTATVVPDVDMPYLTDVDTHPDDGTLFGIDRDGLYRYDAWGGGRWMNQGYGGFDVGGGAPPINDPNGLAIDHEGTGYITAENKLYSIDLMSGKATYVGSPGGDLFASGDCVVDKGNTLYMTSKKRGEGDTLVELSRETGEGQIIGESGAVGFEKVYALTSAWGELYGLTSNGELIKIDRRSGVGSHIHTFEGKNFWGAASTPNR